MKPGVLRDMKKCLSYLAATLIVATGCSTSLKYDLHRVSIEAPEVNDEQAEVRHDMLRESDLFRKPTPPKRMTSAEKNEYVEGYEAGWKDAVDDVVVITVSGDDHLYFMGIPASVSFESDTDAFLRGMKEGASQARVDFNTFCIELEKTIRAQNQASQSIGASAPQTER